MERQSIEISELERANTTLEREYNQALTSLQQVRHDLDLAESTVRECRTWKHAVVEWHAKTRDVYEKFVDDYGTWAPAVLEYSNDVIATTNKWDTSLAQIAVAPKDFLAYRPSDFPYYDGTRTCHSWTDIVTHNVLFPDIPLWKKLPGLYKPYDTNLVPFREMFGVNNASVGNEYGVWYELRNIPSVRGGGAIHEHWATVVDRKIREAVKFINRAVRVAADLSNMHWPALGLPPSQPGPFPELPPSPL